MPFENSTHGAVVFTLDLFADRLGIYPNVVVCAETYLDVHHFLLAPRSFSAADGGDIEDSGTLTPTHTNPTPVLPSAKPLRSLSHIKHVYSHPQALGQCDGFLSTYLKHVERHEVSSTSKAAELVARTGSADCAAIASQVAAVVHNLDVLAKRIEDKEDNTTRFLILKRSAKPAAEDPLPDTLFPGSRQLKNLLSFTIDHQSPGALAEALLVFKGHALNLTSINPRPSGERPWHYVFLVEFRSPEDRPDLVRGALADIRKVVKSCRWLGSWLMQS